MLYRFTAAAAVAIAALAVPAKAITVKDCAARYRAAQDAGKPKGENRNGFRQSGCEPVSSSASGEAKPILASAKDLKAPAAPAVTVSKDVVFPQSVDKKFANESPGKARMHTCLEQYRINKKNNALGGLKWRSKGGYYSQCNTRLKG